MKKQYIIPASNPYQISIHHMVAESITMTSTEGGKGTDAIKDEDGSTPTEIEGDARQSIGLWDNVW